MPSPTRSDSAESTFVSNFGAFTPLPNAFLDHAMPFLNDTEWRLLCVITRATLGWVKGSDMDERKTRDWLTHSQLMARTGRSSEAVSRALKTLVIRHLVEVQNQRGELLLTAQERRRNGGRLYYSLHAASKNAARQMSSLNNTFSEKRPVIHGTTKEKENKELPSGSAVPMVTQERSSVLEVQSWKQSATPNPDVRRFLRAYQRKLHEWQERGSSENLERLIWGRDGRIVRQLLETHDYFRLLTLLDQFLERQTRRVVTVSLPAFQAWLKADEKPRRKQNDRFSTVRYGRWIQAGRVRGKRTR